MGGFCFKMDLQFSFIVPVYNRPDEIQELLQSFVEQKDQSFELVIVEDGSEKTSESIVKGFNDKLDISYFIKKNTGPGDSRNYAMKKAKGNYFIILDSDCILPSSYFTEVKKELNNEFVHCFGGPDKAHESFSVIQKAIDFSMTSFITTGGIRGRKNHLDKFQPRSFNMGLSKEAFLKTGGFGTIHPGEDPDLVFRLWKVGYKTRLFEKAYVYHKRRISWKKFNIQVSKFGMVRAILNKRHQGTAKLTYWFPTFFLIGFLVASALFYVGYSLPLIFFGIYLGLVFLTSIFQTKNILVAVYSIFASLIQFFGYGWGFLKSTILVNFSKKQPEELFPKLFFKT